MQDSKKMAEFARQELQLETAKLSNEYFYQSLPLCVVDAVFSIGVRYGCVINVVERLCKKLVLTKYRDHGSAFPPPREQFTVSQCLEQLNRHAPQVLAKTMFENEQRTSSRKGILKAKAVMDFLALLKTYQVETFQDLATCDIEGLKREILEIPGQKSGKCFRYFLMLAGDDSQVKPDRMIERFIARFGAKPASPDEAYHIITALAAQLKADYPHITPRLLDHAIWNYERQQKTPAKGSQSTATSCKAPLAG